MFKQQMYVILHSPENCSVYGKYAAIFISELLAITRSTPPPPAATGVSVNQTSWPTSLHVCMFASACVVSQRIAGLAVRPPAQRTA